MTAAPIASRSPLIGSMLYQRMMHEVYSAQRQALLGLRNGSEISTEVARGSSASSTSRSRGWKV